MQAYRSHGATVDIMTELVTTRHTKMVIIGTAMNLYTNLGRVSLNVIVIHFLYNDII